VLDAQTDPLVLRGVPERQEVDLARVEVLRVELEVAVRVLVDAAREQREEDGDALLRDLFEARVILQGQALKAPATLKLVVFALPVGQCRKRPTNARDERVQRQLQVGAQRRKEPYRNVGC